jgi:hypothetical protein
MGAPAAHERNTSFAWRDHTGPFGHVTTAQARQYDEDRFFVLEDALHPAQVDALTAVVDPFEERAAAGAAPGRRRRRTGPRRQHRGVLVADAAFDRAQPDRRGCARPTSCSSAGRGHGAPAPS